MIFTHSLASDWNHGHAHFIRGIARELMTAGHHVTTYEPRDGWSAHNLIRDHGPRALTAYHEAYPELRPVRRTYDPERVDVPRILRDADLVLVQEWTDPSIVHRIAKTAQQDGGLRTYFHDAHHRITTAPREIRGLHVEEYDAVLAFGDPVRERYLENGWARRAFTWHEAADTRLFYPRKPRGVMKNVVWIGNWGDEERTREFQEYLLDPARNLRLDGSVYGVRYLPRGIQALESAGLFYEGYLPNHRVPQVYADHLLTVHIPRRVYRDTLPGIPTIRVFEALACGIPLICAPWPDPEPLFRDRDFVMAHDGEEAAYWIQTLREDEDLRYRTGRNGLETVRKHHTCRHRVDELVRIDEQVRGGQYPVKTPAQDGNQAPAPTAAQTPGLQAAPTPKKPTTHWTSKDATHSSGPRIAFFGSSLVSGYWNGAATYYRGLLRALAQQGCSITFYEPNALDRQKHRDMADPDWARVVVYPAEDISGLRSALKDARTADVVVKASGVGVHDAYLERAVLDLQDEHTQVVYWDVDAPATLDRLHDDENDPLRSWIPRYDHVFTYGGGNVVQEAYRALGARGCTPVYNGLDPDTHYPVEPDPRYRCDLAFLGNRLPDRETRVESFFLGPARQHARKTFILGGSGWETKQLPENVRAIGHVPPPEHNGLNCSARAVLNIHRDSMSRTGWSPATRIFEAAGAGACLITDPSGGLEHFFTPGKELLVAEDGAQVTEVLDSLDVEIAHRIGRRARERALREHTYERRAKQIMEPLGKRPRKEVTS